MGCEEGGAGAHEVKGVCVNGVDENEGGVTVDQLEESDGLLRERTGGERLKF